MSSSLGTLLKEVFKVGTASTDLTNILSSLKYAVHTIATPPKKPSIYPSTLLTLYTFFSHTLLPLTIRHPDQTIRLLAGLISHVLAQLDKVYASKESDEKFMEGRKPLGEAWECVLEGLLRGLKAFLSQEENRERILSGADKILVGDHCFKPLANIVKLEKMRVALQRQVFDIWDYACAKSPHNKDLLAQEAVLGPRLLGSVLVASADYGLTERALETALRLREQVAKDDDKGKTKMHRFSSLLFLSSSTPALMERFLKLKVTNIEDETPGFLQTLSELDPTNFQTLHILRLSSNGRTFSSDEDDPNLFDSNVAFNRTSFTAITIKVIREEETFEQPLEVDFSSIQRVLIGPEREDMHLVRIVTRQPPTLDSRALDLAPETDEHYIEFVMPSEQLEKLETILESRSLTYHIAPSSSKSSPTARGASFPTPARTPHPFQAPIVVPVPVVVPSHIETPKSHKKSSIVPAPAPASSKIKPTPAKRVEPIEVIVPLGESMSATKRQKKEVEQEGKKKLVAFDSVVMSENIPPPPRREELVVLAPDSDEQVFENEQLAMQEEEEEEEEEDQSGEEAANLSQLLRSQFPDKSNQDMMEVLKKVLMGAAVQEVETTEDDEEDQEEERAMEEDETYQAHAKAHAIDIDKENVATVPHHRHDIDASTRSLLGGYKPPVFNPHARLSSTTTKKQSSKKHQKKKQKKDKDVKQPISPGRKPKSPRRAFKPLIQEDESISEDEGEFSQQAPISEEQQQLTAVLIDLTELVVHKFSIRRQAHQTHCEAGLRSLDTASQTLATEFVLLSENVLGGLKNKWEKGRDERLKKVGKLSKLGKEGVGAS